MSTSNEIGPVPIALAVVAVAVYLFCLLARQDKPVALAASSWSLGVFITATVGARYLDGYPYLASFLAVQLAAAALTILLFVLGKRLTPNPAWLPSVSTVPKEPEDLERLRGSIGGSILILLFLNTLNFFIGPKPTCFNEYSSYSIIKCIRSHQLFGSGNSLFFAFYLGGSLNSLFVILTALSIMQLALRAVLTKKEHEAARKDASNK